MPSPDSPAQPEVAYESMRHLPGVRVRWDDFNMSADIPDSTHDHGPHLHAHSAPTTQQIRTVGQRRREAEEKLEHHLQEARHKEHPHHDGDAEPAEPDSVDSSDVAAIQGDEDLTAADRVDMIANQVVPEGEGSTGRQ